MPTHTHTIKKDPQVQFDDLLTQAARIARDQGWNPTETKTAFDAKLRELGVPKEQKLTLKEVTPDEELVELFCYYDGCASDTRSYFIHILDHMKHKQVTRILFVSSLMKARNCSFETAMAYYARMKKILNSDEALEDIRANRIMMEWVKHTAVKKH